ncbi:MAG: helix-turn-helix domain-containing protein [Hyphomicrobiaceae bacterium]
MISPAQIRAARALLGLRQSELALAAGVALATVQRIEKSDAEISGSAKTLLKLHAALEQLGIIFIPKDEDRGVGVRLRKPSGNR